MFGMFQRNFGEIIVEKPLNKFKGTVKKSRGNFEEILKRFWNFKESIKKFYGNLKKIHGTIRIISENKLTL